MKPIILLTAILTFTGCMTPVEREAQSRAWVEDPPHKVCNRCGKSVWIIDPATGETERHLRKAGTKSGFEECR